MVSIPLQPLVKISFAIVTFLAISVIGSALSQDIEQVPTAVEETPLADPALSPVLKRMLESPSLSSNLKRSLKLIHGQWADLKPQTPNESADLAWGRYQLDQIELDDEQIDPTLRARAALFRGDSEAVKNLLADDNTILATLLKAQALSEAGNLADAVELLSPLRDRFLHETLEDPVELTAAAQSIVMLAHLEGRPSQDYRLALRMLGRVTQELDPLYWPAYVAEAQLLQTKDNREEAAAAYEQALSLHPNCGPAWAGLGQLALDGYNFDLATQIIDRLQEINPDHPLADELAIRSFIKQRDIVSARELNHSGLERLPRRREQLALAVAIAGMSYRQTEIEAVLRAFDEVAPGSPLALFTAGEALATDRQYAAAEDLLRQAIRRSPNWPAPRLGLGLLLMQAGDLPAARIELADAARLDPFHLRVNNQLRLVENLLGVYETIETPHFIIRYSPGIDEVLARDMPGPLEAMHRELTAVFQHRPANKTQIDIMPDQATFAVRITGMPHIWTIAAATGDVISLTPPRSGPGQADPFNWVNVLRHELVHTITLAQTRNRVPHWFTEACAVSVETTGRTYETCQLLAGALEHDQLFAYDQINWGFVRPKTPRDRPLAYAQADWMLEFLAAQWSHQSIVDLLGLYQEGVSDTEALRQVTGYDADQFMAAFRDWATRQVIAWGLAPTDRDKTLELVVTTEGKGLSIDELTRLVNQGGRPDPDLLKTIAARSLELDDPDASRHWLARYAATRPVDSWPHEALVKLAFQASDPEAALGSLQILERSDSYTSNWSLQLAELHRKAGRFKEAGQAIERALQCEPYRAAYRELAATIALQRGDLAGAAYQVESLEMLEPDRVQHPLRLAVIYERLGQEVSANQAARRARKIDASAPVDRFLSEPMPD